MKIYGGVWDGKRIRFSNGPDHHADCPIGNLSISQQIMNGLQWNFMEGCGVVKGTSEQVVRF